jgi:class 3 adenylate cyclase
MLVRHYKNPRMNDATPSLKQLNRTFIGSVLFIDIVGYAKRTVPDQHEMKELFNRLLAEAVQNVAHAERIMVDTGDGAAIAFLGDPEDALFAALSLRDAIDEGRATLGEPGFVRMGINLGPLKMVRDINGHTNMIGDGVNDAQRVMSFAEPGQVMVAHSYYDIISRFSRDYAQLFVYEGTRHDKHVREHEVYRFGPVADNESLADKLRDRSRARQIEAAEWSAHDRSSVRGAAFGARKSAARRKKKALSRFGLIATALGAASVVGAVWSWTATSQPAGVAVVAAGPAEEFSAAADASAPRIPAQDPIAAFAEPEAEKAPAARAGEKTAKNRDTPTDALGETSISPDIKPGTVKLAVQPWGEIYIDGNKRGISPPLKSLTLPPGKHRVEVRNGQFAAYKETVDVKSGKEVTVRYAF